MRKFTPHAPLADIFVRESDWQKDDQMPVAHDDLYAQSWNTNFGPNPFEDGPPDHTQNTDDIECVHVEVPEINLPTSLEFLKNSGGSPVEQSTDREEENHDNKKFKMMRQKSPKKPQKKQHQKHKPKKPQKTHKIPHCKKNP